MRVCVAVAIACAGCGGFRFAAGPTVTTEGAVGVQVSATIVYNLGVGVGGGGAVRADTDALVASGAGTLDVTIPNNLGDDDPHSTPTRLARFSATAGRAKIYRDGASETVGMFGFGAAYAKVIAAKRTCTIGGSHDQTGLGGELTLNVERRSTGSVGVIGAGVILTFDTWLNFKKC